MCHLVCILGLCILSFCLCIELFIIICICIEVHNFWCSINEHSGRCDMEYVLLEMDLILRLNGYVIIHESNYFLDAISTISKGMKWGCQKHNNEYYMHKEKILICQKRLWHSTDGNQWNKIEIRNRLLHWWIISFAISKKCTRFLFVLADLPVQSPFYCVLWWWRSAVFMIEKKCHQSEEHVIHIKDI